ncbi:MAG: hypothetical protein DSY32_02700 [Aquifex sp.]|nr:MAG: hypothetical protein DSY32_02700 [Aquifex sp.]
MRSRIPRKEIKSLAFALYDTGETILGALVVSTFFPLYITKHIDVKIYSLSYGISFLISFASALLLGKIADEKALRKKFFALFSLLTSLFLISLTPLYSVPLIALFAFLFMLISHQQAMVFYNSLLLNFENKGFASGLGVSFGYIGSAAALIFLAKSLKEPEVYTTVGVLFLILAIPSILLLENPKISSEVSIKEVFKDKNFLLFLVSLFSITEVANTLIAMMGVYLREVYSLENPEIYRIIGLSALGGVIGGVFWGILTDKFSVNKIFPIGFLLWFSFFVFLFFATREILILVGLIAGFSLAHLWSTSRVYIVENFPKESVSVRMSFLSLTERVASSFGLFLWSFLLFITKNDFKLSALLMGILPLIGLGVYIFTHGKR